MARSGRRYLRRSLFLKLRLFSFISVKLLLGEHERRKLLLHYGFAELTKIDFIH